MQKIILLYALTGILSVGGTFYIGVNTIPTKYGGMEEMWSMHRLFYYKGLASCKK